MNANLNPSKIAQNFYTGSRLMQGYYFALEAANYHTEAAMVAVHLGKKNRPQKANEDDKGRGELIAAACGFDDEEIARTFWACCNAGEYQVEAEIVKSTMETM